MRLRGILGNVSYNDDNDDNGLFQYFVFCLYKDLL